jgi:hypothetical protein
LFLTGCAQGIWLRAVIVRLSRFFIVLALAGSIGLHWAFLQSVAWVGMVISYSESAPLSEALAKTFDGRHPCSLCKEIAHGKAADKKPEYRPEWKKFEFSYSAAVSFVFRAPAHFWQMRPLETTAERLNSAPPFPPPRTLPG